MGGSLLIKRDDGRLGQRYIEPANPNPPAGAAPQSCRRERQVASALRNCTDFVIATVNRCGDGRTGRAGGGSRPRRTADPR
jgi:hypothetical protein